MGAGSYVELSVSDSGIGMDAATRDRIFEPFFTTKEPGKGTGLGLATVFGIVKQHDGYIQVESEPGSGATFRLFLPVTTKAGSAAQTGKTAAESLEGGSETLLIAEDHEGLREIARVALERRGYRVLVAADGNEAVAIFRSRSGEIALAIMDLVMPRTGGHAAAAALRLIKPDLPILFTTGYSSDASALAEAAEKGEVILNKPYKPAVLAGKVRELLDRGFCKTPHSVSAAPQKLATSRPQRA